MPNSCPDCNSTNFRGNGKSISGIQRYICRDCKRSWTGNEQGRPPIAQRGLSPSEMQKRSRGTKIHFGSSQGDSACGMARSKWEAEVTLNTDRVNCKSCMKTIAFKNAVREKKSKSREQQKV